MRGENSAMEEELPASAAPPSDTVANYRIATDYNPINEGIKRRVCKRVAASTFIMLVLGLSIFFYMLPSYIAYFGVEENYLKNIKSASSKVGQIGNAADQCAMQQLLLMLDRYRVFSLQETSRPRKIHEYLFEKIKGRRRGTSGNYIETLYLKYNLLYFEAQIR